MTDRQSAPSTRRASGDWSAYAPPTRAEGSAALRGPTSTEHHSASEGTHSRRVRSVLLALGPAVIALVFGAVAFEGVRQARVSRLWVAHTREVLLRASMTLSTLQDAETGQRGFLLTDDPSFLAPYDAAVIALREDTATLRALTKDNPSQQRRLDSLEILLSERMGQLSSVLALHRAGSLDSMTRLARLTAGHKKTMELRSQLGRLVAVEQSLLEQRQASEAHWGRNVSIILIGGALAAALLSLLLTGRLLHFANVNARMVGELGEQNLLLEQQGLELEMQAQQLQDQAAELEMQNEELHTTTEELMQSSTQLEAANTLLAERTSAAESAQAVAEAANAAKSNFLAMMSHELRTPLNAIAGYAQLMQLGVPEKVPEPHQVYLTRIQQSQYHLLGVINSVLNFARVEAGTVTYDMKDVAVGELLADVEPLIAPQAQARDHRYSCAPCDRALVMRADPDKVTQILLNLLSNAIKFTPKGGTITLSAEARDGLIEFRVRDSGLGIPPEMQNVIFDPFLQLDTSRTRTSEGTGLGLSISRNLARGMGGDLTVESVLGVGSTFTLTLPQPA